MMVEPKLRLMNFVPESQGEELQVNEGTRTGDGFDNRPLFEILKENKDKKDAEFNERFKHRPPKALDDDETEFLENVEMIKREQERQRVEEEKLQLINFQTEILSRTIPAEEPKTVHTQEQQRQEAPLRNKRASQVRVMPVAVKIKPIPKRRKVECAPEVSKREESEVDNSLDLSSPINNQSDQLRKELNPPLVASPVGLLGLASYGDESDEDDD